MPRAERRSNQVRSPANPGGLRQPMHVDMLDIQLVLEHSDDLVARTVPHREAVR
jgi:hypothetical protein